MTRLEKAMSLDTGGCSKFEMVTYYCPHDFGVESDAKRYRGVWECEMPSGGCKECWYKEVKDDKT